MRLSLIVTHSYTGCHKIPCARRALVGTHGHKSIVVIDHMLWLPVAVSFGLGSPYWCRYGPFVMGPGVNSIRRSGFMTEVGLYVIMFPLSLVCACADTEKLDALRRWREMFFWVDDALVPWNFAFYTQGLLPRDERPPPGSYSMEDAELINENLYPTFSSAYSGRWICLAVIPTRALSGTRAGATEIESTDVLAPTPLRSVPKVDFGLKRKRATGDDGAGPSKRVRHLSLGLSTSTEEESSDVSPTPACQRGRYQTLPQQAALVAQLRARFSNERSQSIQKDEEILLLKTQLADAQAEAESSRSYAQKLAEEKMALLVKNNHFAAVVDFRPHNVEGLLEKSRRGGEVTQARIEYDEECTLTCCQTIARAQEAVLGDVVKCAWARGTGYNQKGHMRSLLLLWRRMKMFRAALISHSGASGTGLPHRFLHLEMDFILQDFDQYLALIGTWPNGESIKALGLADFGLVEVIEPVILCAIWVPQYWSPLSIYLGKWIAVLWTCFVGVCGSPRISQLPSALFDNNWVGDASHGNRLLHDTCLTSLLPPPDLALSAL
ncbi:hypothetical protein Tco_1123622 [Tanacetum coccineum]|uniref:Uncharacterized protein n=1 Tax=Tanacetum coccineum TaxID=301880 RepID=A0ABQ5J3Y6_9ASTR